MDRGRARSKGRTALLQNVIPSPFTEKAHIRQSRTKFRIYVYVADYKSGEPRSNILAMDAMIVRKQKGLGR